MRRGEYQYQVTPDSLQKASQQELQVSQFIGLLKKHQTQETAPGLLNALQRFEEGRGFAKIQASVLLRIEDEGVMRKVKQSDAKKYILEEINPTTLSIDKKGIEHFQAKLTELGYLCHIDGEV
jgi:ABC-type phosphate transport system auxiliary subunit